MQKAQITELRPSFENVQPARGSSKYEFIGTEGNEEKESAGRFSNECGDGKRKATGRGKNKKRLSKIREGRC